MSPEELANVKVPVTLGYHQAKAAKSALHALIRKLRTEMVKKPFTPEPGHINLTEAKLQTATEASNVLEGALERSTMPDYIDDDVIWCRDLDGTGSMHPCTPHDPGAIAFRRMG